MKKLRILLALLPMVAVSANLKAQIFDNYSVYSFAPGYSSSPDETSEGFSLTAHGQGGAGLWHVELSSTLGYGKEFFMNEYLTLDFAVGIPFVINDNSEALIALSPLSINLSTEPNLGLATLLKYRYGLIFVESKLLLADYSKGQTNIPFLSNKSYFSVKRRLGDIFGLGIRYTSFTKTDHILALFIFFGFEDN
jgi:hypothetical protein